MVVGGGPSLECRKDRIRGGGGKSRSRALGLSSAQATIQSLLSTPCCMGYRRQGRAPGEEGGEVLAHSATLAEVGSGLSAFLIQKLCTILTECSSKESHR